MSEAFVEFFVLGRIPGTDFMIGYKTSLVLAGSLVLSIVLYATIRYRHFVKRRLTDLSPENLIELITI